MQPNKQIDLFKVFMAPEAPALVEQTLLSGFIGQGKRVDEFESELKEHFKHPYVSTVNSATSGLQLALNIAKDTVDFRDNDEVLTTPLTCTATNFAILANNMRLKWVDVDPKDCNIDLNDLARKLSPTTKIVMVVHWGGYAVDLAKLDSILETFKNIHGFKPVVIEDCAHAWGSSYNGKLIGCHGNLSVFSFQAIKHLTTGDGGAIISHDHATYKRINLLRWYGLDRTASTDFRCEQDIKEWGYKFHMNDIAASIGICNLKYANANVATHMDNSSFYQQALASVNGVTLLESLPNRRSSAWIYTMHVDRRADFIKRMREKKIAVSLVHARNDKHSCLSKFRCILPSMDQIAQTMITIPCGWWVTKEDREYIKDTITEGW